MMHYDATVASFDYCYFSFYPKASDGDKQEEEEEEEFYNSEEYSYEYEVGSRSDEWLIHELWETSV